MKRISFNFILLLSFSLLVIGCRKNNRDEQNDLTAAIDNTTAQNIFDGVWRQIIELGDSSTVVRAGLPTVSYSSLNPSIWAKTVTIDYDSGVVCNDGHFRKGKIMAVFSKKITDSLTNVNITFDDYFHNSDSIKGNMTIYNTGRKNGLYYFNISVQNAAIYNGGGTIFWAANQTKIWYEGENTKNDISDDIFLTSGTSSGICLNGNSFTTKITTSLKSSVECGWTNSGSFITYPKNYSTITVDYGSGICDKVATATINQQDSEITLR